MDRLRLIETISKEVDESRKDCIDFLKEVVSKDSRIFDHGIKG